MAIKLVDYAKINGISYKTAWRAFKAGKLKNAEKLPTGSIIIKTEEEKHETTDLRKLIERLEEVVERMEKIKEEVK
jgi:predicted site-specific integrase-resolvase